MSNPPKNQEPIKLKLRKGSQKSRILELLNAGVVLDDMKALRLVGCWSLSQRIGELINPGVRIEKIWKYNPKSNAGRHHF